MKSDGGWSFAPTLAPASFMQELTMVHLALPALGAFIWIGGGALGLILIIILVVLLLRR
jgi:hypothetical protein